MKRVAKVLIRDENGKLLFLLRGKTHPNFPGHLDLPGGEVEKEEHAMKAVIREVREETGIVISLGQLSKAFALSYPDVEHILYEALVDASNINIALSWEHEAYEWLSPEEIITRGTNSSMDQYYIDVYIYLADTIQ